MHADKAMEHPLPRGILHGAISFPVVYRRPNRHLFDSRCLHTPSEGLQNSVGIYLSGKRHTTRLVEDFHLSLLEPPARLG